MVANDRKKYQLLKQIKNTKRAITTMHKEDETSKKQTNTIFIKRSNPHNNRQNLVRKQMIEQHEHSKSG